MVGDDMELQANCWTFALGNSADSAASAWVCGDYSPLSTNCNTVISFHTAGVRLLEKISVQVSASFWKSSRAPFSSIGELDCSGLSDSAASVFFAEESSKFSGLPEAARVPAAEGRVLWPMPKAGADLHDRGCECAVLKVSKCYQALQWCST